MAVLVRLHSTEIQNGNIIDADDLNAEFNQLVTESNDQNTRLGGIETGTTTLTQVKTTSIVEVTSGGGTAVNHLRLSSIGTTIASVDTTTNNITTTAPHNLITPDAVTFTTTGTLPAPLAPNTIYFIGYLTASSFNLYSTRQNALTSTSAIDLTTAGTGVHTLVGRSHVPAAGDIWYNAAETRFELFSNSTTGIIYPTVARYDASAASVWVSNTTASRALIDCAASNQLKRIVKTTSTTIDITTLGSNGIANSGNLAGTITANSGTTGVTGVGTAFTTDFVVGDVIRTNGGNARRITVIGSNTSITVESNWGATESGVAYSRGGRAPNTWYYEYAIDNGTDVALLLSPRNVAGGQTLVDIPSGWRLFDNTVQFSKQFRMAYRLDASSNIVRYQHDRASGFVSYIDVGTATAPYNITNASGSSTSAANYSLVTQIPAISRRARIQGEHAVPSTANRYRLQERGQTNWNNVAWCPTLAVASFCVDQTTDANRDISGSLDTGTGTITLWCTGWWPTDATLY